jgi:hypothetical protein
MGFGSYDESEQDNQEIDTEQMEDSEEDEMRENEHKGDIEFNMEDTESAIERLKNMRSEESD